MPVYTYRREDGTTFDIKQSFNDAPLKTDPHTGQAVTRVVQAAGVIFKGSGFYINDSKGGARSSSNMSTPKENPATESKGAEGAKSEPAAAASTDSAPKTESKPEAKPAAKPAPAAPAAD
jgi:predicted nucleic acid-binding Zn ribbon protein